MLGFFAKNDKTLEGRKDISSDRQISILNIRHEVRNTSIIIEKRDQINTYNLYYARAM